MPREADIDRRVSNVLKDDDLYKIISGDDDVKAAMKDLVVVVLKSTMDILESGVGPTRDSIIRSMLPTIIRAMAKTDEEVHNEIAELRKDFEDTMAAIMGAPPDSTTNRPTDGSTNGSEGNDGEPDAAS